MRQNPVTVPYWDQWDGEARALYLPFSECSLTWAQMFSQHNEHRFFFSRLLALDLLMANGQWDPRLQQVVNAALHSLVAVLLVAILWIAQERRRLESSSDRRRGDVCTPVRLGKHPLGISVWLLFPVALFHPRPVADDHAQRWHASVVSRVALRLVRSCLPVQVGWSCQWRSPGLPP